MLMGLLMASSLAGGAIWAGRWRGVHVNFVTRPFGATIYIDGTLQKDTDGVPYRTPCTIEGLSPRIHHVEFKYDERDTSLHGGELDFAKQRRIEMHWASQGPDRP